MASAYDNWLTRDIEAQYENDEYMEQFYEEADSLWQAGNLNDEWVEWTQDALDTLGAKRLGANTSRSFLSVYEDFIQHVAERLEKQSRKNNQIDYGD